MGQEPVVIVKIRGGLGNQLFCYAAGRALAARNGVPLRLDVASAYRNDRFGRSYLLDRFNVSAKTASASESYEGLVGGWRRRAQVHLAKYIGSARCPYLMERQKPFDAEIAEFRVTRPVYVDGYWQNVRYFGDAEQIVREDLVLKTEHISESLALAAQMRGCNSVSVHLRSYAEVINGPEHDALLPQYYANALEIVRGRIATPRFFCFSDAPDWARKVLSSEPDVVFVTHNNIRGDAGALEDLWLMGQCRHHIIANSAFSWWGAWLNPSSDKLVIGPAVGRGGLRDWLPDAWVGL